MANKKNEVHDSVNNNAAGLNEQAKTDPEKAEK